MVISTESFGKICRLCLSDKPDLVKIYHQKDVIKRLCEFTGVEVHRADDLPQQICGLCLFQLNTSYAFKNLCETSDAELRKILAAEQEKDATTEEVHVRTRGHSQLEIYKDAGVNEDVEQNKPIEPKRKKMCCLYCSQYVDKLPKHLMTFHRSEKEVKKLMNYPPQSRKRLNIIAHLRRLGNNQQHQKLSNESHADEEKQDTSVEYFPCTTCLGYYSKPMLMNHMRNCQKKKMNTRRAANGASKLSASKILATCILPQLRSDSVLKQIKSDPLILMYGSELCIRNDMKLNSVKGKIKKLIRQIARLLLALKKRNSDITQMIDIFDAKYIDLVVETMDDIASFDTEANVYVKYNLVTGLCSGLRKCGNIIIANAVIQGNESLKSNVVEFLKMFEEKFGQRMSNTNRFKQRRIRNVEAADDDTEAGENEEDNAEVMIPIETTSESQNVLAIKQDSDGESMTVENDEDIKVEKVKKKHDESDVEEIGKHKFVRRSWSMMEKLTVSKYFGEDIATGTLPTKEAVFHLLEMEPCLEGRTCQQVKAWISNQQRMARRKEMRMREEEEEGDR